MFSKQSVRVASTAWKHPTRRVIQLPRFPVCDGLFTKLSDMNKYALQSLKAFQTYVLARSHCAAHAPAPPQRP